MINNKRIAALLLTVTMTVTLLTGCSVGKKVSLEKGKIKDKSIVMTIGNTGVKYNEIQNYSYLLKQQYEESYGSELWKYPLSKNMTIGDEAKEEIINMVTQLKIIASEADSEKVTLTNDEKDEARQKAENVFKMASENDKKEYQLSLQGLCDIYEENLIANKMFYIATDDANTEVSDDEAKQIKIQYIHIITNGKKQNGQQIALTKTEKTKAKQRVEGILAEVKKTKDFLEVAKRNSDDSNFEIQIGKDSTEIDAEAINAAFNQKKGDISGVITAQSGYYIIQCINDNDTDATYARKEQIIAQRQTKMFKEKYAKWLGKESVSISKDFWKKFSIS